MLIRTLLFAALSLGVVPTTALAKEQTISTFYRSIHRTLSQRARKVRPQNTHIPNAYQNVHWALRHDARVKSPAVDVHCKQRGPALRTYAEFLMVQTKKGRSDWIEGKGYWARR